MFVTDKFPDRMISMERIGEIRKWCGKCWSSYPGMQIGNVFAIKLVIFSRACRIALLSGSVGIDEEVEGGNTSVGRKVYEIALDNINVAGIGPGKILSQYDDIEEKLKDKQTSFIIISGSDFSEAGPGSLE